MTTMRQRLVEAIERASNRYIQEIGNNADWADVPYEIFADAVLAELMSPSEAMVEALLTRFYAPTDWRTALGRTEIGPEVETASAAFTAAIKAAREGK